MARAKVKSNDDLILELKKQVEEKRAKVQKNRTFVSKSNCNLELDGQRFNLRTLKKDQVIHLLVKLAVYKETAIALALPIEDYVISGFTIDIWIEDLENLLVNLSIREEEKELQAMEAKLTELLSHDKKVELELSKIMDKLNK